MKKTTLTIVMALLCLNFAYSQLKNNNRNPNALKNYKYGFCGYKSGYKPGVKITKDVFNKAKMMTVRNLPIAQLFAVALNRGEQLPEAQLVLDVRDPKKLWELRCYQLIVPANQVDNFYVIMHQNLNYEFPEYLATMEMRDNILHLVLTDKDDQL